MKNFAQNLKNKKKSSAQRAEQQGQREVRERGDEEYGPIVYKSSMYMDDENEQSQGIEGIHFFQSHTC